MSPLQLCMTPLPVQTFLVHVAGDGEGSRWSTEVVDMKCVCQQHSSNRRLQQGQDKSVNVSKIGVTSWQRAAREAAAAGRNSRGRAGCGPWLPVNGTVLQGFPLSLENVSEWVSISNQLPGNNNLFTINHLTQRCLAALDKNTRAFPSVRPRVKMRWSASIQFGHGNACEASTAALACEWFGSEDLQQCFWPPDFLQLG